MNETFDSSEENQKYNDESNLLDSLYEFHPEFFEALTPDESNALRTYYLTGQEVPENVFIYRKGLISRDPNIEGKAKKAYSKVLSAANIEK